MKTIIVWYRNDLRVHDHPALSKAVADADHVIPVFVFDPLLYEGKHAGSNRNRFLIECLHDLKDSLKQRGADLVIREGTPQKVLAELAKEFHADAVYYTADYSPLATRRDKRTEAALEKSNVLCKSFPGRLIVSNLDAIRTKAGTPHKVFTPYWKVWLQVGRRELASTPQHIAFPSTVRVGVTPSLDTLTEEADLSPDVIKGGETEGAKRLQAFLKSDIDDYAELNNDLAADATSRLSAYFHFGCLSPLAVEAALSQSKGAQAWRRQLAWRDFYHYVLFYNPQNAQKEYQEKYRQLQWDDTPKLLKAWQEGKTGYPVVDAAMRQLKQEGWMHNRARLIVGSFLTKDLWLDWRLGEQYFMRVLIDGDEANNNGNWQWIASVGVDPAPVYRRLYNPASQRDTYDPTGAYVRMYVPELQHVPDKYLSQPWMMPESVQQEAKCRIGEDYPAPIVDHAEARRVALERYSNT
jgi:deoxyribodipyrimidine photo-lyase